MALGIGHSHRPSLSTIEQNTCQTSMEKVRSIKNMISHPVHCHYDVASRMRIMKDGRLKAMRERVENSIPLNSKVSSM